MHGLMHESPIHSERTQKLEPAVLLDCVSLTAGLSRTTKVTKVGSEGLV